MLFSSKIIMIFKSSDYNFSQILKENVDLSFIFF